MCFRDEKLSYVGDREIIKRKFFKEEGMLIIFEEIGNII